MAQKKSLEPLCYNTAIAALAISLHFSPGDKGGYEVLLSVEEARGVMLSAQGLFDPPPASLDQAAVQNMIDQLGVVQIDTISVIERSQYLVLWSRLGAYDAELLDDLLANRRAVFEYWSHAASIVPMCDYPYYRANMVHAYEYHLWTGIHDWMRHNPEAIEKTLDRIRTQGAMASADFEGPAVARKSEPWEWYGPKESRRALHILWTTGDLMISGRRGGQKLYDLRERVLTEARDAFNGVLPSDEALPSLEEQARHFVNRTVHALGILTPSWLWDYFRMRPQLQIAAAGGGKMAARSAARAVLDGLASQGLVLPVRVEGVPEPAYLALERLPDVERQRAGQTPQRTTLLSPFDNLIWHRARAETLFGYEVCFEAYVAPEKRRYGYYCLAILHHGSIVGRVDAKALRRQSVLLVRSLHLEPDVHPHSSLVDGMAQALCDLARFLKLATVQIDFVEPRALVAGLKRQLPGVAGLGSRAAANVAIHN